MHIHKYKITDLYYIVIKFLAIKTVCDTFTFIRIILLLKKFTRNIMSEISNIIIYPRKFQCLGCRGKITVRFLCDLIHLDSISHGFVNNECLSIRGPAYQSCVVKFYINTQRFTIFRREILRVPQ